MLLAQIIKLTHLYIIPIFNIFDILKKFRSGGLAVNRILFQSEEDGGESKKESKAKKILNENEEYEKKYLDKLENMKKIFFNDRLSMVKCCEEEKEKIKKSIEIEIKELEATKHLYLNAESGSDEEIESDEDDGSYEDNENKEIEEKIVLKKKLLNDENELILQAYRLVRENKQCEKVEGLKNNYIFEYTPQGNVIMFYEDDYFSYYASRSVTYNNLLTVCRKFIISNNCLFLYPKEKEKQRINFRYKGVINNFNFLKKPTSEKIRKSKVSFAEFKKTQ